VSTHQELLDHLLTDLVNAHRDLESAVASMMRSTDSAQVDYWRKLVEYHDAKSSTIFKRLMRVWVKEEPAQ